MSTTYPTVNLNTAGRLDIICRRNDSFQLVLEFNATIPTSGWKMDVVTKSGGTVIIPDTEFSYVISDGVATNSKLTISAQAAEMIAAAGLYVYDIQNTHTSSDVDGADLVKTYLFGTFKVVGDITT